MTTEFYREKHCCQVGCQRYNKKTWSSFPRAGAQIEILRSGRPNGNSLSCPSRVRGLKLLALLWYECGANILFFSAFLLAFVASMISKTAVIYFEFQADGRVFGQSGLLNPHTGDVFEQVSLHLQKKTPRNTDCKPLQFP